MKPGTPLYGLMVEFITAGEILAATRLARQAGYRNMDAYTPYPVKGLAAELGLPKSRIPVVVLLGGLIGAGTGFLLQYYAMAMNYTFNVGGRPYNSWPAFIPITFELLILVGSLAAFLAMLLFNGLPRLHHPVFNVPQFARSSQDRFFLCIEAIDPHFDRSATAGFLAGLNPHGEVIEVPRSPLPLGEDRSIVSSPSGKGPG
jgi:hypothetical protein